MVFIFTIFIASLLPQDKEVYKKYSKDNDAQLILYTDSTFEYRERKPTKLVDRGTWSVKSDSVTIQSGKINSKAERILFDGNQFPLYDKEIFIFHSVYKLYFVFTEVKK
jgi:hypothetical protein